MTSILLTGPANPPIAGGGASKPEVLAEREAREAGDALAVKKAENLKDVASVATSRINLGLGTAATQAIAAFDAAGAATSAEAAAIAKTKLEEERALTAEALLAPKASPTFTGTVTIPTPAVGDKTTKAASTAFVSTAIGSSPEFLLNILDFGAISGEDCTEAIENAQKKAEELPGTWGVFAPRGTWIYSKTLMQRVPWFGIPRKTIFKRTSTFEYLSLEAQFSVINVHASTTFNAATADTVIIEGIDFEIEGTAEPGKGAIGLANVIGGRIWDCYLKTNGTNVVNALVDIYAVVKNFGLDVKTENLTQAKTGGNIWIRNLAAKPEEAGQVTENIYVSPRSRCTTTTGDEAIAVFGVFGLVRNVLIDGATLIGGASAEKHQRLGSTFPSAVAEKPNAGIENVEWRKCTFIDIENTIKENGEVLGIGRGTGTTYLCQNIKHVDCSFYVKTAATKVVVTRNIPSKIEGETSGIEAVRPYINAVGSTEPISCGMLEYPTVEGGTTVGNILQACRRCNKVTGGNWEATEKLFSDCNSVGGNFKGFIPNTTGVTFFREANTGTWSGVASYGMGVVTGGRSLLVVKTTVESGNTIIVSGVTMTTTAEAGNLIETPTEGSIPEVILRGNTTTGPKSLTRKGTFAQAEGNNWYGVAENVNLAAESVVAEKIGKEAVETEKIKNESITSAKLATGSVTATKIGAESVETGKIKEGAVTEAKLGAAAVTEAKIGPEAVATGKIKNEAVIAEKIGTGAVTETKLGTESVTSAKLKTGAVTEAKIGAEAVVASKVKPATTPTGSPEENKVVLGETGVARKRVAALTGNGILTKFVVKHNLETRTIISTVLTESFEEPVTMLAKVVSISLSEVEVTFTVALGAKAINYVVLAG
jgi:hypothetical protein